MACPRLGSSLMCAEMTKMNRKEMIHSAASRPEPAVKLRRNMNRFTPALSQIFFAKDKTGAHHAVRAAHHASHFPSAACKQRVNGPSLTECTCMKAPKTPD